MAEIKKIEIISKLPTVFTRTLKDGQELCPECGGIQLVSDGKIITSCKSCLGKNGVLSRCQYCGEIDVYNHTCKGKKDAEREDRANREAEKWNKTPKVTLDEAIERFEMVFIDQADEYIATDMLMKWIADRESDDDEFDRSALRVYGTYKTKICFDAGTIIEDACDDLHEEASDRISCKAMNELQGILDNWAKKHGDGTTTYNADKIGIIIPPNANKKPSP